MHSRQERGGFANANIAHRREFTTNFEAGLGMFADDGSTRWYTGDVSRLQIDNGGLQLNPENAVGGDNGGAAIGLFGDLSLNEMKLNPTVSFKVRYNPTDPSEAYLTCGFVCDNTSIAPDQVHIGFHIESIEGGGATLKGSWANNSEDSHTETPDLLDSEDELDTMTELYLVKTDFQIDFYVNGDLRATATNNIPSGINEGGGSGFNGGYLNLGAFGQSAGLIVEAAGYGYDLK